MSDKPTTKPILERRPTWRDYQARLNSSKTSQRRYVNLIFLTLFGAILISGLYFLGSRISGMITQASPDASQAALADQTNAADDRIRKKDIRILIDSKAFVNLNNRQFTFDYEGRPFTIATSLDIPLQNRMLQAMDRTNSRYIAVVAMAPDTGRILALASFDKTGALDNPCTSNGFPAASIFKIVTAAAAVEQCGYRALSPMKFNGYKHTLYKSQLKEKSNRYTNKISFKDSFAQSVNPVFGKIGVLYLGKPQLEAYGDAFGFNHSFGFEIPCAPSLLTIADNPYHWAEIASGFNNQTTLSPLHGAILAAVPINQGRLVEPSIVDRIVDNNGEVFYRSKPTFVGQATSAETAQVVTALMEATIKTGTSHKTFRGYKRDKVLSRLKIGGKTGSIYDKAHTTRFDWFVGFAHDLHGEGKMVVSVLVAHEKYIGRRASEYARIAFKQYFKKALAPTDHPGPKIAG